MANHYKILQKARLTEELFVHDQDDDAWEQAEADREWTLGLQSEADAPAMPLLEAAPQSRAVIASLPAPAPLAGLLRIEPELEALPRGPRRNWSEMLAETTGISALEGVRALGVCALDEGVGSTRMAAALASWAAQHSDTEVLLVEAHAGAPRLAKELNLQRSGLLETLMHSDSVTSLVQDTSHLNLKALTGGKRASSKGRRKIIDETSTLLGSLKSRYPSLIVELPAVNDSAFHKMPIGGMADAVILVASSRTARPRKLRQAAETLRRLKVIFAGTLLDAVQLGQAKPWA